MCPINSGPVGRDFLNQFFFNFQVRPSHILRAAGPDEPHVASPTWSETSLDKPDLDHTISKEELEDVLNTPLPEHPKLIRGQLKNGLRYLILPNKVPANRLANFFFLLVSINYFWRSTFINHNILLLAQKYFHDLLPYIT